MYFRPASPAQTQNRTRLKLAVVEAQTGTYVVVLSPRATGIVRVGRLGRLRLQSGFYVYVGSAHASGARGRLRHHLELSSRPHWHIDYLRRHTSLEEVWYCYDGISREHQWALCLGTQAGASIPLAGFGTSDCQCEPHLYFFRSRPSRKVFVRSLRTSDQKHPQVRLLSLPSCRIGSEVSA
jgi:Uri superfamily endonuclease